MSGIMELMNGRSMSDDFYREQKVHYGLALAVVSNIKDPKNMNRVKCRYITDDKDPGETGWIHCLTLFGGNQNGVFFHVNVGDVVALAFENGNPSRPFVIGSVWLDKNKPPLTVKEGKNEEFRITTPNKSFIDFADEKSKEKITVSTPKKRKLVLDDENQKIELRDEKNSVIINEKTGEITITAEKKLTIKVGKKASVTIDGTTGTIKVESRKDVNIDALQINAKAKSSAAIEGKSSVSVKSGGSATVSASGSLKAEGSASATVKSGGILTLKGTLTKIN